MDYYDEVEYCMDVLQSTLFKVVMLSTNSPTPHQVIMPAATFKQMSNFVDLVNKNGWNDALTLTLGNGADRVIFSGDLLDNATLFFVHPIAV